ncbi:M23 family metallopeptidase [Anaeromusa acidaminophila]|uniref:M23 family metallopeptidase n=1 Tax=Anaeromusa acidaminophila TaxID=81464 RepID=UPI0003769638|nr:M23 family metallopeptidase [Anaeromusa acidaminophila]
MKRLLGILVLVGCLTVWQTGICAAYTVTSPFGMRIHPISGTWQFHNGVDLALDYGTPIGTLWDGQVIYANQWSGYGNCIVVAHANEVYTLYAHLSRLAVNEGAYIGAGTLVGYVGNSGYSTGPHLHLSIWQGSQWIDPLSVIGQ